MPQTIESLKGLAEHIMRERGLEPAYPEEELQQLAQIRHPAQGPPGCADLRSLMWCSIDNDSSHDLDQLTYAETLQEGKTRVWIAIADVDALVPKETPIDRHAQINTTTVYTPTKIFSMLPERLSTDLTSLNEHEDRLALVIAITFNPQGEREDSSIVQALVRNYAQLAYNAVGRWLEGTDSIPDKVKSLPALEKTLRCQHALAQLLKDRRSAQGSLTLETVEVEPELNKDQEIILKPSEHNFAHQLIEELMIAANVEMAHHLEEAKISSISRVVRVPKRWDRIVEIAHSLGEHLPDQPDPQALNDFLIRRKQADPIAFPDLSLAVIKLLGRGEYIVRNPDEKPIGHFGLALSSYTHSTAPNRRFPDLIAQRQYKAHLHQE
ncbi:ribonuclease catalytic domain-containing protein, partial [Chlamydiota bacterium]